MSSSKCPNCGTMLTCGCQRRVASNGASVCSNCLAHYEQSLKNKNAVVKKQDPPIFPGTPPSGNTAPSNVNISVIQRIEHL